MYLELHTSSAFSFLDGASLPESIVTRAAELGYPAVALLDRDGLYGAPRFYRAAKAAGLKAIVGAELTVEAASRPADRLARKPLTRQRAGLEPQALRRMPSFLLPVLVSSAEGYRNLCRVLTRAKLRAPKGESWLTLEDLDGHTAGLIALVGRAALDTERHGVGGLIDRLVGVFGRSHVWIEFQRHLRRDDPMVTDSLLDLAAAFRLPVMASNGVRFDAPAARPLYDVLTCLRHKVSIEQAGTILSANAERYLKSPATMARLFSDLPQALAGTEALAERLEFTLDNLGYRFPDYPVPTGETQVSFLRRLTQVGARDRYRPYHDRARAQIARELNLIEKLELAGYFLIVWDLVSFCRRQGILVQGRGSAANSAVCYALGITAVDPVGMDLLFERFLSEERGEWPDIDLDLPSGDQRERVIQYVYERYGSLGAAMTANVITYRGRSAARDVGKVLSLNDQEIDRLAKLMSQFEFVDPADTIARHLREADLNPDDRRYQQFAKLWQEMQDLPRHLGQHSGGMVICQGRLDEIVPLENASMPGRVVVQWDKDDCADLGIVKVDLLGLGMMAALEEAIAIVNGAADDEPASRTVGRGGATPPALNERPSRTAWGGGAPTSERVGGRGGATPPALNERPSRTAWGGGAPTSERVGGRGGATPPALNERPSRTAWGGGAPTSERVGGRGGATPPALRIDLAHLPPDDPAVYRMLQQADTIGVFQVESRAQMATLPRMKPVTFYDIVVEVAIIRPGPIVGKMVHPYLNRRSGVEPVQYDHPLLEPVLARTLGVPLFQEQLLRMAMVVANFTGGEAEELRRAMGFKRSVKRMQQIEARLRSGMAENGISAEAADRIVQSITSFALYGFPESHAASFALIVYASAYLKAHYPAAFYTALLNNQPMGFYHPATLVKDAQRHGVRFAPIDVQVSKWNCVVQADGAVRLGLRYVRGLSAEMGRRIEAVPGPRRFASVDAIARAVDLRQDDMRTLAEVGAFAPFGGDRRTALWQAEVAGRPGGPLLSEGDGRQEAEDSTPSPLPRMSLVERVAADYAGTGLTIGPHPMALVRASLATRGIARAADLARARTGRRVRVAGAVLVRQRPGTAKGFVFLSLEDETGIANAIVTPDVFAANKRVIVDEPYLIIEGWLQNQDGAVSIKVDRVDALRPAAPAVPSHDFH